MRAGFIMGLLLVAGLPAGCAAGPEIAATPTVAPRPARINHVVFFKLHDPAEAAELIRDCDTRLAAIPGVAAYYAGRRLEGDRDMVAADYDVGIYFGFMSEADYAAYLTHPAHVEVVAKWRPRLAWIQAHDIVDETP